MCLTACLPDEAHACLPDQDLAVLQSQRPMSSSEGQEAPAGPVQEPSDRWLGARGPGQVEVGVQYTIRGNGDITSSWQVDTTKAIPSKLPPFMYRCDTEGLHICFTVFSCCSCQLILGAVLQDSTVSADEPSG